MNKKNQIINEILKMAEESPADEYKRQSELIDKNIDKINAYWKKAKFLYDKKLKRNPKSWSGIGRATELGDLVIKTKEMVEHLKPMAGWIGE